MVNYNLIVGSVTESRMSRHFNDYKEQNPTVQAGNLCISKEYVDLIKGVITDFHHQRETVFVF